MKIKMRHTRIIVIGMWLASLALAWFIIERFVRGSLNVPGYSEPIVRVMEEDRGQVRADTLKPVSIVYAAYLGEMLLFVFCSRWTKKAGPRDDLTRFVLALLCTLLFNGMFLYVLSRPLADSTNVLRLEDSARDAALQARNWSFLAAPILAFYFGKKPSS